MSQNEKTAAGSTTGLFGDALQHMAGLIRGEIDLARAEVQENAAKAVQAIGLLVGAVVVILVALNVLAAAIAAGLTEAGLEPGWAALIVGGVLAIIGVVMALKGQSDLKPMNLAPTRTAKNVRRDAAAVREAAND